MSEFEKYIEAKYPNRSPKILFQKFKDIDGTLFYGVKEIEDQAEVWSHQQAKIELLEKEITETQAFLNNQNHIKQAEIDRLNSVLDERTKEWLQAIECGTYFENVAKPLKAENDELKKRIEIQQVLLDISKPKLHKTDMGDCLHFSTTMFHEGKAECFDCGAVVNQARKVIGIKQALRGGHE